MAEEMAFDLEEAAADYERRGHTREEARRLARLHFGSVDRFQEESREELRARWLEQFVEDVRYAWRTFSAQKLWALSIVVVLALGVGANTAVFSLVDAVLFRQPDALRPQELVRVYVNRGDSDDPRTKARRPIRCFRTFAVRAGCRTSPRRRRPRSTW